MTDTIRVRRLGLMVATVATVMGAIVATRAADSADVMSKVRKALGGDKLEKVTGLTIEGKYRRHIGDRELSGDIEVAIALPDKFLHVETMAFDPTNPVRRVSGFNGTKTLDSFSGGGGNFVMRMGDGGGGPGGPGGGPDGAGRGGGAGGPGAPGGANGRPTPEEMEARRLRAAHRDFGRMLATFLVGSSATFPLEYRYGGDAESDDGKADMIEITGPEDFSARLFVDKETHLPLMLMYRDAMPRMQMFRGGGGGRGAGGGQRPSPEEVQRRMREARQAGPPPQTDVQLFLSDYKKFDGVQIPQTIRRAVAGETVEEWQVTGARINPSFKPDKFDKK